MKICFTGGGTLGSVSPLLALAEALPRADCMWIGTSNGPERPFVEKANIPFSHIPTMKFRRYVSLQTVIELPNLIRALRQAKKLLKEHKPDCIVSAGSYVSVPVCNAARKLGIPYVLLQLDLHVGLANKLLEKRAQHVFVSFPELAQRFHVHTTVSGIPVPKIFYESTKITGDEHANPTICFIGGGTGSSWMNHLVLKLADALLEKANILHIQGIAERRVTIEPTTTAPSYASFSSVTREEMARILDQSTVVCTRSGMGTLADCSAKKKACIIVPMPHTHQEENAKYIAEKRACILFAQQEPREKLMEYIVELLYNAQRRAQLGAALYSLLPQQAAKTIADYLLTQYA